MCELRPDAPAQLEQIVHTLLQLSPEDRYEDARSLHTAIDTLMQGQQWRVTPEEIGDLVAQLCPEGIDLPQEVRQATAAAAQPIATSHTIPAVTPVRTLEEDSTQPPIDPMFLSQTLSRNMVQPQTPPREDPLQQNIVWAALIVLSLAAAAGVWWFWPAKDRPTWRSPNPNTTTPDLPATEMTPAPALGHVILYVTPKETDVLIDQTLLSPSAKQPPPHARRYKFTHKPGKAKLTLQHDGYHTREQTLLVPKDTTLSQTLELRPKPVHVEIKTEQPHAGTASITTQEGYRTDCALPCKTRLPSPGKVDVRVTLADREDVQPWISSQTVKAGGSVIFTAPVPVLKKKAAPKLRATVTMKQNGQKTRASLLSANLTRKAKGTGRVRLSDKLSVTLRYQYHPNREKLSFWLASDPWSTASLNGASLGQTPVVNPELGPGSHRIRLGTHNATILLRFTTPR